jgi:sugar/nucleoside kinase (ribokinase family)
MDKKYDVFGIGNPLIDILAKVEDAQLVELNLNKGIMHLIEEDRRAEILDKIKDVPKKISPGGDCPNTMITLAMLNQKAVLAGKIGNDEFGEIFEKQVTDKGVISSLVKEDGVTGSSIILISPDSERTMNTHLGKCRDFSKQDLDVKKLKQSRFFYFTGYMWDTEKQKEATREALKIAQKNNIAVIFDVADPFAVKRNKEDFLNIIKAYVDVLFANEEEAKILSGKESAENAIGELSQYTDITVVKCGSNGSLVKKEILYKIPSYKVKAVDTTGAGDMYAAGFIYGLCRNYDLMHIGKIASFLASKVVQQIGAQLPKIPFEELEHLD